MGDGERSQAVRFMRFLATLLAVLMLANFGLASVTYGDAPAHLFLGAVGLFAWLFFTSNLWGRWSR